MHCLSLKRTGRRRKGRKHCTADDKVVILRRHLLDKVQVFDLCEKLGSF